MTHSNIYHPAKYFPGPATNETPACHCQPNPPENFWWCADETILRLIFLNNNSMVVLTG